MACKYLQFGYFHTVRNFLRFPKMTIASLWMLRFDERLAGLASSHEEGGGEPDGAWAHVTQTEL